MKPVTARTLIWASAIFLLVGLIIMSPSAQFFLMVLAALLVAAPVFLVQGSLRIVAVILLFLSLFLAAYTYPSFQADQRAYRERAIKAR